MSFSFGTMTMPLTVTRQKIWRLPCRKRAVNLRKMWHLLTFTGVHRSENPRFSNCFAVGESEYSFHYRVFSRYGESQKTAVFWNSLEFAILGKYKKTVENFCECGNTPCFPYVNRAENSDKQCVLRNLTAFSVLENKGKCRFSIVKPG